MGILYMYYINAVSSLCPIGQWEEESDLLWEIMVGERLGRAFLPVQPSLPSYLIREEMMRERGRDTHRGNPSQNIRGRDMPPMW